MGGGKGMDLTEGNLSRQVISFSFPILVGYLFQNLYNSVDSMVVGNFVSKYALGAVNACSPISMLLTSFFVGVSSGASVLFSQCFGAQKYEKLKRAIHTTVLLSTAVGVGMTVLGILFCRQLLMIVDCPADIFDDASQYLRIYIGGLFFTSVYNVEAGVLRAVGDSRSPFYALLTASVVNVALDVLLVCAADMGVAGVAIATVISQMISAWVTLQRMRRMDGRYAFRFRELAVAPELVEEVIRLGLPAGVQMSVISLSNLFVSRYINSFSSAATAGVGVASRLDRFVSMPSQALGLAVTTFVSQNLGARKPKRAARSVWNCCLMACASAVIIGVPLLLWPERFVGLFNQDPEVIAYGVHMLRALIPFYLVMAVNQVMSGAIRGYGYSTAVMVCSLLGMVGLRQLYLAISMHIAWRIKFVYYGYPVGWGAQLLLLAAYFCYVKMTGNRRIRAAGGANGDDGPSSGPAA